MQQFDQRIHKHWLAGRARLALVALWAGLLAAGVAQGQPMVERVTVEARAEGPGYVVRFQMSERLGAYSTPRFLAPGRLEVVLFNANLSGAYQPPPPHEAIPRLDLAPRQGHLAATLTLDPSLKAELARDRASDDLLLVLAYGSGGAPAPPVRRASTTGSAVGAPGDPPLHDARDRWKLDTIVIDAGHGGHDAGAIGAGGLREKDVVLPVALRVGQYLESELGVRVVYTRRDDRFVTLRERGKIANRGGGKLFVSIHANAAHNRRAQGTETYFLGLHKTDAAHRVMERENSVVRLESDPDAYAALGEQALIVQTLAQSAYLRQSEHLAALIQERFTDRVGRTDRGVKQAGFYVLWSASMPAVLVELGFVTNPQEAAFLESAAGQEHLARAIFQAVRAFKADYERGLAGAID